MAFAFEVCLEDKVGVRLHLKAHPDGLLTWYSEYGDDVLGTVIGSYKVLPGNKVMLGGNVNINCDLGFFPGQLNAILDLQTMTGKANGFLYLCIGTIAPLESEINPCGNTPGRPANWHEFDEFREIEND